MTQLEKATALPVLGARHRRTPLRPTERRRAHVAQVIIAAAAHSPAVGLLWRRRRRLPQEARCASERNGGGAPLHEPAVRRRSRERRSPPVGRPTRRSRFIATATAVPPPCHHSAPVWPPKLLCVDTGTRVVVVVVVVVAVVVPAAGPPPSKAHAAPFALAAEPTSVAKRMWSAARRSPSAGIAPNTGSRSALRAVEGTARASNLTRGTTTPPPEPTVTARLRWWSPSAAPPSCHWSSAELWERHMRSASRRHGASAFLAAAVSRPRDDDAPRSPLSSRYAPATAPRRLRIAPRRHRRCPRRPRCCGQ